MKQFIGIFVEYDYNHGEIYTHLLGVFNNKDDIQISFNNYLEERIDELLAIHESEDREYFADEYGDFTLSIFEVDNKSL
jgi:hypothetical protein